MLQLFAGDVFVFAPPLRQTTGSPVPPLSTAGFVEVNAAPETPSAPATKNTRNAASAVVIARPACLGRGPNFLVKLNALPPFGRPHLSGGAHARRRRRTTQATSKLRTAGQRPQGPVGPGNVELAQRGVVRT